MATNREMLKEAIADAKAVKETAIANAKAALEEAFAPQLKSMLSMKLQEMELEEEDEYVTDKTEHDDKPYSKKTASKITDFKAVDEDGFGEFDTKENTGYNSSMFKKALDEEDDDMTNEIDLEELLAELNDEEEMEESINEAEEGEEDEESEESEEGKEEGEPIDLEDMTDEDLKDMIEDVIKDMISSGELEAGHEGEKGEEGEEGMEDMEGEEEIDLAELLREIEEMEEGKPTEMEEGLFSSRSLMSYLTDVKKMDKMAAKQALKDLEDKRVSPISADEIKDLSTYLSKDFEAKRVASMINPLIAAVKGVEQAPKRYGYGDEGIGGVSMGESELAEALSTIETLKSELNEINLLNAKLLYTNKIFKAKNLNESQKVKVLSSFDKANNVGEVKMVFETLNEGIKVSKNMIKENLGSASKGTMAPVTKKPIVESNEAFLRMQKLAGII
jgi:hypothetical protein